MDHNFFITMIPRAIDVHKLNLPFKWLNESHDKKPDIELNC